MTKRRTPKKTHPWRQYNPFATKPEPLKLVMSYIAENPKFKKSKRVTSQKGASVSTH